MARWKKLKRPKPRKRSDVACDLCGAEMAEDYTDAIMFTTSRPCLVPGWEALMTMGEDKRDVPVVWSGMTLGVVCPSCTPDLPAYRANIAALMEQEDAEPMEAVVAGPPLSWAEVELMMAQHTGGTTSRFNLPEGRWRADVAETEER